MQDSTERHSDHKAEDQHWPAAQRSRKTTDRNQCRQMIEPDDRMTEAG